MKKALANSTSFLLKKCLRMEAAATAIAGRRVGTAAARNNRNTLRVPFTTVASPSPESAVSSSDWVSGTRNLSSTSSGTTTSPGVSDRGGSIIEGAPSSSPVAAIHLPPAEGPVGLKLYKKAIYCPASRVLRTSAHVGTDDHNRKADGIVGESVTPQEARKHARNSGLRLLATIHDYLDGDLGRVEQVLHLRGMVKSTADFAGHMGVIDGCSEVLVEALGPDVGIGTRETLGVGSLGATVACNLEVRVRPLE